MSPLLAITSAGLATVLAWPLSRWLGRGAGWPLAVLYILGAVALLPAVGTVSAGRSTETVRIPWVPARDWTLDLHADPTGLLFAMLALVIGAVVLIYSSSYLTGVGDDGARIQHYGFFQLMTLFTVSMLGLVLTDSLLLLFVCWELTSLASFALIANSGRSAYPAALRTLLVTFVGGLALLAAVVAMWLRTGTTSISEVLAHEVWSTDPGFTATIAVLVAVAAMTKSAQFPFHFWLPDAMAAATPVSAYLHAAAVVKAGIFLVMRFSPAFHDSGVWIALLVSVGMGTAVMAALFALQKTDLKQLLAYSTVSQLGWIVAAIGVGTPEALAAAALHTLAHALFKSGLFMLIGAVDHETGTRDIRRLGPGWRRMPWSCAATVLGAAAMAGIPPTLGFMSKESMLTAFGDVAGGASLAATALLTAAVVGAILTVLYCARIVMGAFLGSYSDPDRRDVAHVHEAPALLWVPAALPAVIGLPVALAPGGLDAPLTAIADAATGGAESGFEVHLALWHGFTLELGLTVLILAVAGVLVWRYRSVDRVLDRDLLPVTGAATLEALVHSTARLGRQLVRPMDSDSPSRHAGALIATICAYTLGIGLWALTTGTGLPERTAGLDRVVDAVFLAIVVVAVLGLCAARSRLAAVVLLSAVGIVVTVQIFALGAPDVGLTQLLIEALTIIVFMLVLRRLPWWFIRPSRRRRRTAAVLGVAAGVSATVGVLALTGRRERSPISEYLLVEGPEITGGTNIVNTILVEFRALDTFGEVSVLGVAGIAILAVLGSVRASRNTFDREVVVAESHASADQTTAHHRPEIHAEAPADRSPGTPATEALEDATRNTMPLRLLTLGVTPVLGIVSVILLWRGHNEPGGGFIAALVAACAVALIYLARGADNPVSRNSTPVLLIGGGLLLAGLTGVGGYALGAFLEPAHWYISGQHITSALIFDLGVYTSVLGLVLTAFNTLGGADSSGQETRDDPPAGDEQTSEEVRR